MGSFAQDFLHQCFAWNLESKIFYPSLQGRVQREHSGYMIITDTSPTKKRETAAKFWASKMLGSGGRLRDIASRCFQVGPTLLLCGIGSR